MGDNRLRALLRRLGKFSMVGVLSAAVDYGSFQLFRIIAAAPIANILAMCLSLAVNFALNRAWAFRARGRLGRSMTLYLALFLANLGITTLAVAQLARVMDDRVAKLIAMAVSSCWNFVLYQKVIFVPERVPEGSKEEPRTP